MRTRKRTSRTSVRRNEMIKIYESWDYLLQEKLAAADHITRRMFTDMGASGIPQAMYIPFLQQKFNEMVQNIAKEAAQ